MQVLPTECTCWIFSNKFTPQNIYPGVCSFRSNLAKRQILWSFCSVDFNTLTLHLPIQTQNSVAPELQAVVSSLQISAKRAHLSASSPANVSSGNSKLICFFTLYLILVVYFKTTFSDELTIPAGEIIPWDKVLNNVGNGYNGTTHKFIAPMDGTYMFTVTVMNARAGYAYLRMDFGLDHGCTALAAGDNHQTGVCTHTLQLTTGQEVRVVNSGGSGAAQYNGNGATTFAGLLVHANV